MRVCVDCGVEFGTPKSRAKRCPTCRKAHRYGMRIDWARRNRERMNAYARASYWKHREKNIAQMQAWRDANREYTRAYAIARYWRNPDHYRALSRDYAARQKKVRAALTNPDAWAVVNAPQLRTCQRLHVTALNLPCGQREECHLNPVCEHAGGFKARNANWGWRGGDGGSLERVLRKGKAA